MDSKCAAREIECRSKQKGYAEKVEELTKEKDRRKKVVDTLTAALMRAVDSVPGKCGTSMPE